jgi:hypothetical protein
LLSGAVGSGQSSALRIVVVGGEDGVNIVGKGTAVAPLVEVRDRNDLPVSGASVVFLIGGKNAKFAGNAARLAVTTDQSGRATASGLQAVGKGAVRIEVQATYQGETVTATVTQTNFANVAEAAQAGKSVTTQTGSNSASQGASQAAAQGSHHIGLIAVGAGAVAGGIVARGPLGKLLCNDGPLHDKFHAYTDAAELYFECRTISNQNQATCAPQLNAANAAAQPFIDANNSYCSCISDTSVLTKAYTDEFISRFDNPSGGGSEIGAPMCAGDWP